MERLKGGNFNAHRPILFRVVWLYYVATPVFLLAEVLLGISFRVPYFLSAQGLRYVYYGFCAACGAGCYFRPGATYIIAFVESTINVILLFTGFGLAMYGGLDSFIESGGMGEVPEVFTIKWVIGFGITGSIWIISFKYGLWKLEKKWKNDWKIE